MNARKYGGDDPVVTARALDNQAIAAVNSNTRRRKWWLYVKLSTLEGQLTADPATGKPAPLQKDFDVRALAKGFTSPADVVALRPLKMPISMRIAEVFGGDRAKEHRAAEKIKALRRAELARLWWWDTLITGTAPTQGRRGEYKPPPRNVDPAAVDVRENIEESGDVMLATWCGPDDETIEPTW